MNRKRKKKANAEGTKTMQETEEKIYVKTNSHLQTEKFIPLSSKKISYFF